MKNQIPKHFLYFIIPLYFHKKAGSEIFKYVAKSPFCFACWNIEHRFLFVSGCKYFEWSMISMSGLLIFPSVTSPFLIVYVFSHVFVLC